MNSLIRWNRPTLSTWGGFGRLSEFRDEIDRLFGVPFAGLAQGSHLVNVWTPALDVYEDKDSFTVKAELPGLKRDEIELSIHEGSLSISGERKREQKQSDGEAYRSERFFGRFLRTVSLPAPVAADKAKAQYKDGILTVTLPKSEEAKPRHIGVNVG